MKSGIIAIFLIFSASMLGAQNYYSNTPPSSFDYDPFATKSSTGMISAYVTSTNNSDRYYFWTIAQAPGSRFLTNGGYQVPVSFYKSGVTPLEEIKTGAGSGLSYADVLWGYIPKKTIVTNQHYYDIIPSLGSIVPAGTYSGTFTFRFYRGAPGSNRALQTTTYITMTMAVLGRGDLSIVNANSAFNVGSKSLALDFTDVSGKLLNGTARGFDVMVKSNQTYSLSVSTSSQGYLIHKTISTEKVPYTFTFNGSNYSLASATVSLLNNVAWTSGGEARYPVSVTLGSFDDFDLEPGQYSDNLTFTLLVN
jgi:hypothetical protein